MPREHGSDVSIIWEGIFQECNESVPRVGRKFYNDGDPLVENTQPFTVKHVVLCRGTNRVQMPQMGQAPEDIPMRVTMIVDRATGAVRQDGEVEEWSRLPRYRQMRSQKPARISLTAYGIPPLVSPQERVPHQQETSENPVRSSSAHPEPESQDVQKPEGNQGMVTGYPPRVVPKHGPGYLALSETDKSELTRLHNNLGHPDNSLLVKFLTERKAEPYFIQAARDYACSTCHETSVGPKLARPSTIHVDGDFGDVIGMDVAYWTSAQGKKYMFTHVLDEATLFHQAVATGRTPEDQFAVLADSWFKWAGPCKTLYVDPAGEYVGDHFREQLQREGIQAHVSAGEAHWQLGRVEAHGRIIKSMLTRMDSQDAILSESDFRQCLRAVFQAKNSLSRVRGFTPEQAVLGKMSRLPGSLISDDQASTHALASSDLPEGVAFRKDLQRREQARVAFVRADNDNSYRRAMLRRSRPACQKFEPGDWILYWRRQKAGSRGRGENGRWYGLAQVVWGDGKVVWVSHCGQLIRAAPEHMERRTREISEIGASTRQVVDLVGQGIYPLREEVEAEGETHIS